MSPAELTPNFAFSTSFYFHQHKCAQWENTKNDTKIVNELDAIHVFDHEIDGLHVVALVQQFVSVGVKWILKTQWERITSNQQQSKCLKLCLNLWQIQFALLSTRDLQENKKHACNPVQFKCILSAFFFNRVV